jgi:hypothetical protein
MKLLYALLLLLTPFISHGEGDPIDKTAELIRSANIEELSKSFAPAIQVTIMDDENICSGAQAKILLGNFFKQNPPRSVKILHRIQSNPNYRFAVIILTTSNEVFRTSFSLKKTGDKFEMTEIRIETERSK